MRVYKNLSANKINETKNFEYIVKSIIIDARRMNSGRISRRFVPSKLFLGMQAAACIFMIWAVIQLMIG